MPLDSILADAKKKMKASLETLKKEMATVRTGRANAGILDSVKVEYYGSEMPLTQLAGVSVPEGQLTMADMRAYEARDLAPTHSTHRGLDVYGMASPSSGGIAVTTGSNALVSHWCASTDSSTWPWLVRAR